MYVAVKNHFHKKTLLFFLKGQPLTRLPHEESNCKELVLISVKNRFSSIA